MINIELMKKLYMVVAHNLNQARKARDGNKKNRTVKEPEEVKIGDNVLVRDHMSKAFQPKYKDFCIIEILGKNQVEVKDNHGHTTKVHRTDVKNDRKILPTVQRRTKRKSQRRKKSGTSQLNARTRMGHSRNRHTDIITTARNHTTKQPANITHPPNNDKHSHADYSSIGTYQNIHPGNPSISKNYDPNDKKMYGTAFLPSLTFPICSSSYS